MAVYAIHTSNGSNANRVMGSAGSQHINMGRAESSDEYNLGYTTQSAWQANAGVDRDNDPLTIPFHEDRFVIQTYRYDSENLYHTHRLNGFEMIDSAGAASKFAAFDLGVASDSRRARAYVMEVILHETALSDADLNAVEGYLADKYGIYHPDATWTQGYSNTQEDFIIQNLWTRDEVIPPGPLDHTFGLESGLILFTPLRDDLADISVSQFTLTGQTEFNTSDRFGIADEALYFAGTNGLWINEEINPETAMTVSTWIRHDGVSGGDGTDVIIGGYDGIPDSDETFLLSLENTDGINLSFYTYSGTVTLSESVSAAASPTYQTWSHLITQYDPVTGAALYVDLDEVDAAPADGPLRQADQPISIGAENEEIARNFRSLDGSLNEVMIWNRALSEEERRTLYFIQSDPVTNAEFSQLIRSLYAIYQDSVTVNWQGSTDPDPTDLPEDLVYELDYRLSSGAAWQPVFDFQIAQGANGVDNTGTYIWNVTGLPDTQDAWVRMRAFDGVDFSTYDVSGPFRINNGPPVNTSIAIIAEGSAPFTSVDIDLFAEGATELRISELPDFSDTSWQPYTTQIEDFPLLSLTFPQRVYAQFRDQFEEASEVIYDEIVAPITIDASITLVAGDPTYLDQDVVIDGPVTVTIDGPYAFASLSLVNGATLTTPATTTDTGHRLELTIAGELSIDATSAIDVSSKGHLPGYTYDYYSGLTPYEYDLRTTSIFGGSHGGRGGEIVQYPSNDYGNFVRPSKLGSGSSRYGGTGSAGGGAIHIVAQKLTLEGAIRADGGAELGAGSVPEDYASGGAGGSVLIEITQQISGAGLITAMGGDGADSSSGAAGAGGGGGRIALYCQAFDPAFGLRSQVAAGGGDAAQPGAAGTIYYEERATDTPGIGHLIVDNLGLTSGIETRLYGVWLDDFIFIDAYDPVADITTVSLFDLTYNIDDEYIGLWFYVDPYVNDYFRVMSNTDYTFSVIGNVQVPDPGSPSLSSVLNLSSLTVSGPDGVNLSSPLVPGVTTYLENGGSL